MKKLIQIFIDNRWHLHSIALLLNVAYFVLGYEYNFMHLMTVSVFFRGFLSLFITGIGAFVWELFQMKKGANKTNKEWQQNAIPDIIFTTIIGFIGFLIVEGIY